MIKSKYSDFLLKTNENKLLKIGFDEEKNIYFQVIIYNKCIKKKILYNNILKYIYVFKSNKEVNLMYQDVFGNINISKLINEEIKRKESFAFNKKIITPIDLKGIALGKKDIYFYKKDTENKIYFNNSIIYNNKEDILTNYEVFSNKSFISLIIYSVNVNIFKLLLKTYNKSKKYWNNEVSIFITNRPYIDISFALSKNKIHSLIIISEDKENLLIYKYNYLDKNIENQREIILYEAEDISSCLIIEDNNIIWVFWISKNKMYYCKSLDFGESFSSTLVYLNNVDSSIKKIRFVDNSINKEVYISEKDNEVILILDNLLNFNDYTCEKYKSMLI